MSDIFSADYANVVSEVISGVRKAQQRALLSVNREFVLLRDIEGWMVREIETEYRKGE